MGNKTELLINDLGNIEDEERLLGVFRRCAYAIGYVANTCTTYTSKEVAQLLNAVMGGTDEKGVIDVEDGAFQKKMPHIICHLDLTGVAAGERDSNDLIKKESHDIMLHLDAVERNSDFS